MQVIDSTRPSFLRRAAHLAAVGVCVATLTSCSLFSGRDGETIGYFLPLTVHLRSDPSITGAQLSYQDACGQRQSLPISAPLQELLRRKTGRVFERVLTGETRPSPTLDGYVDASLGLGQVDLVIPRKANKSYPASVTLGIHVAYTTAGGTVLYSEKIQSIGRGEVDVTDASCEVKGLESIAQEAMGLVTDGMAKQLGTASRITDAAQVHQAGDSKQAPAMAPPPVLASTDGASRSVTSAGTEQLTEAASVPASVDEPSTLKFRAIVRNENHHQVLYAGEAVVIEIEVKNEGHGLAQAVELLVTATPSLIEQIPGAISIGDLHPGEVKHLTLNGKVGSVTGALQEELTLMLRAASPSVQLPPAKKFLVSMKPQPGVETTAQPVDVDRLPKRTGLLKQPRAVGLAIGVGRFGKTDIPRVKYAARDAQFMAKYLVSIGGIPSDRVRTLVDAHALKSDLTEALEEWLPEQVDPASVIYVSVTGRGIVEPATGAVSIMVFDSTATSGARLYSLRRLQESLAKLPIQQAIVMLDLSLELATSQKSDHAIAPLWEQGGHGKEKIMWMVGNRGVQESHNFDPGKHGLFTYQLLKGLTGAADFDMDGIVLAGELCTYARGQVIKASHEQYANEQEPLCIPGPGQGAMVRLQPVARLK